MIKAFALEAHRSLCDLRFTVGRLTVITTAAISPRRCRRSSRTATAAGSPRPCARPSIVRAALGRSRGGSSTKIHAIVDAKGRPLHITLTPGERHEMVAARELLDHAHGDAFVADTGYDSNELRAEIRARGIKPVIHSKPERARALPLDRKLYKIRYLVEVCFHELKRFAPSARATTRPGPASWR